MEKQFLFRAVSLGNENNKIVISCLSPDGEITKDSLTHNIEEGKSLAQYLALWLTPVSTNAVVSEFNKMGYHG